MVFGNVFGESEANNTFIQPVDLGHVHVNVMVMNRSFGARVGRRSLQRLPGKPNTLKRIRSYLETKFNF